MSENGVKCSATISQNVLFFAVVVVEILVIVPSTVFTIFNVFASNEDHYKSYHPELSGIVGFHFLLPIFVYQIVWIVANIVSIFAVHTSTHYIFLVTILAPIIGLIVSTVILVPTVNYIITHNFDANPYFLAFGCGLAVFVILLILFIIARFRTLRKLIKKNKVVQTTHEKNPEDPIPAVIAEPEPVRIKDPDEISVSFSRRSTMSMNDELYLPPPRR
ncbi:unnamed protein product [Caenorhabditis sp. 36 PRJEB53466]|nr:unnamed protein product [Caenorhabditis sp. 36 PRJEB53466]